MFIVRDGVNLEQSMVKIMRIYFFLIAILGATWSQAQNTNPYLSQGLISPSPMYDTESKGEASISFVIGNSGEDIIEYSKGEELELTIQLMKGVPLPPNPVSAISGSYAERFNWSYDARERRIRGVQNQPIPGALEGGTGYIQIAYKVMENSTGVGPQCGVRAWLYIPSFLKKDNLNFDDTLQVLTWTIMKPAPMPDFEITRVNQVLNGNVSVNDKIAKGTTYGNPVPKKGNPSACIPEFETTGEFHFACPLAGEYLFDIELCEPQPSKNCMKVPLTITVLAPDSARTGEK